MSRREARLQGCYKVELSWKLQLYKEESEVKLCPRGRRKLRGQESEGFKKLTIKFDGKEEVGYVEVPEAVFAELSVRILGV